MKMIIGARFGCSRDKAGLTGRILCWGSGLGFHHHHAYWNGKNSNCLRFNSIQFSQDPSFALLVSMCERSAFPSRSSLVKTPVLPYLSDV